MDHSTASAPTPCPLVEVAGPPRERGRQYGEQASRRIKLGIDHYSQQLHENRLAWREIETVVGQFEPTIAAYDATFIDEMKGIAEGAGVPYAAVVMLNARTELLKVAERRRNNQPVPVDPDGCTGIVVLPQATAAARLIHAQDWDWKVECKDTCVVLKVHNDDGPDFITFTEAGGLARSGFNAAGISITANYLECDRDYSQLGVPLALIRRKVLLQKHLALAMHTVYTTPKSASNNIMVAQANGIAIDFECAPDETFQVHEQRGVIVHANHWQSPVALTKLRECGIPKTPDSLYRDLRVRQLVEPHIGRIGVEHVKAALFDDFETPWSVCRPPRSGVQDGGQGHHATSASVAMIVMEPALGRLEVSVLPALNPVFTEYQLPMKIARPSARARAL